MTPNLGLTTTVLTERRRSTLVLDRLLWLYLVIPATAAVAVIDVGFLDGWFRQRLATLPEDYVVLALIFGTPHIVASNLILFANRDYRQHYRCHILAVSGGILVVFLVFGWWLPRSFFVVAIVGWTVHHVLKQQIGVGNISSRLSGLAFSVWGWAGVVNGTVLYSAILVGLEGQLFGVVRVVVSTISLVLVGLTVILWFQVGTVQGRWWLGANAAMMLGSTAMFLGGYPLFAVLIPRFAHDATAYLFYVNHEANRWADHKRSLLHRLVPSAVLAVRPVGVVVVVVASFVLAAFLERVADSLVNAFLDAALGVVVFKPVSFGFVGFLALMHYAFEAVTWKGKSPYRSYVRISIVPKAGG